MPTTSTFNRFIRKNLLICLVLCAGIFTNAQRVENRGCPVSYTRNNGNGQMITVFAANITPGSVYAQSALNSGNQGAFTFKWNGTVINPPVVNRTWITNTSNVSALNWNFGNNAIGSPFNPPGIPLVGDVKYNFFNSNLPTSGAITIEFIDPYDGSYVNTCSYPLSSGASSTGALASIAVSSPTNFTYPVALATSSYGASGSSVEPTINAAGGTITYSLETAVSGVSINSSTGVISWDATVAVGDYTLTVKASNGIAPDAYTTYNLSVTNDGVSSGSEGGLESKSLGNVIANRVYMQRVTNQPAKVNYKNTASLQQELQLRTTGLSIRSLIPDELALGASYKGFVTSPTDILSFTNAKEVVSVDYVEKGVNKAVAFCTKTTKEVYTHTKPVCDRLKGSQLLFVDTIQNSGFSFIRYHLKPANGLTEYAISFSAGYNAGDINYTLQSEWITDRYEAQDSMYNFQLWSADAILLNKMLQNVISKLKADMPAVQKGDVVKPSTYIVSAARNDQNQLNLQLAINNQTGNSNAYILVSAKANEQSSNIVTNSYPVSIKPFGISVVEIPLKDMAEAEIRLLVNGKNEDFVYSNDGTWNIYKTANSSVSSFVISNDTIQAKADEYRLFRNISLKAVTNDYITVYRMVKGGGMAADLRSFNFLRFTAKGNGKVRIRLIKKSITNFNEQFEYNVQLQANEKEYSIRLADFKSGTSAEKINANDIIILSFTYEAGGNAATIESAISNVRFTKLGTDLQIAAKTIRCFPNPATTSVNVVFTSEENETLHLQLINAVSGVVLTTKPVVAQKGSNLVVFDLPNNLPAGAYHVKLQSSKQQFNTNIIKY